MQPNQTVVQNGDNIILTTEVSIPREQFIQQQMQELNYIATQVRQHNTSVQQLMQQANQVNENIMAVQAPATIPVDAPTESPVETPVDETS